MGSLSSPAQGLDQTATTCSRLPLTPGTEKRSVDGTACGTHTLTAALPGSCLPSSALPGSALPASSLPASSLLGSALLGSTQLAAQNNASASDQKPISSAHRFCSGGRGCEGRT